MVRITGNNDLKNYVSALTFSFCAYITNKVSVMLTILEIGGKKMIFLLPLVKPGNRSEFWALNNGFSWFSV